MTQHATPTTTGAQLKIANTRIIAELPEPLSDCFMGVFLEALEEHGAHDADNLSPTAVAFDILSDHDSPADKSPLEIAHAIVGKGLQALAATEHCAHCGDPATHYLTNQRNNPFLFLCNICADAVGPWPINEN